MFEGPTKIKYIKSGPSIIVQFYLAQGEIEHITMNPNREDGLGWQIVTNKPQPELEEKVEAWINGYCEKKRGFRHCL